MSVSESTPIELLKEFVPKKFMSDLIELGFDVNKCLIGIDSYGNPRAKIAHSTNGDYVSWEENDRHQPLALWQQAFEFLSEFFLIGVTINKTQNNYMCLIHVDYPNYNKNYTPSFYDMDKIEIKKIMLNLAINIAKEIKK